MPDGVIKKIISLHDVPMGAVVRMCKGADESNPPFNDSTVIRHVDVHDTVREVKVILARPYAYATLGGSVLVGYEQVTVPLRDLKEHYCVILTERGNQHSYFT